MLNTDAGNCILGLCFWTHLIYTRASSYWSCDPLRQQGKRESMARHTIRSVYSSMLAFLELVQASFIGALLKYENAICRKNKKYKDAKSLWSDSVSLQREKKKVLTISQVKFWLIQSQWELNQRPAFQTVISPQRLAQSGIGFIQWSDFIPGLSVFEGKTEEWMFH